MNDKKISAPRGRPRAFDTQAAVEKALALFHARGYDDVGMAELGQAIGVNPPSLYAAFGSKSGIFDAALGAYGANEGAALIAALDAPGDAAERISRLLVRAAERYAADPRGCMVLETAASCAAPGPRAAARAVRAEGRARIAEVIAEERPDLGEVLADDVVAAMSGLSAAARSGLALPGLLHAAETFARGIAARLSAP